MAKLSAAKVMETSASVMVLHYLDEALDIYGSSVKQVVYWKFEKTHNLSRNVINTHPEKFVETIRAIFGTGTSSIEKDIKRVLELKSGLRSADSENLVTVLRKLNRSLGMKES